MTSRDRKPIAETASGNKDRPVRPQVPAPPERALASMTKAERDQVQLQAAEYIQAICIELRQMAQAAELDGLAYFIDMARYEASMQVESRKGGSQSS